MKFLLVGNGGFHNRGCEAISLMTTHILRKYFPNCELVFASFFKNDKLPNDLGNIRYIDAVSEEMWRRGKKDWWRRQYHLLVNKSRAWEVSYSAIERECKTSDVVLSIGGDNYSSDYAGALSYYLDLNKIVRKHKKKLVVWAASIGPFKLKDQEMNIVFDDLRSAELITARESATIRYLKGNGVIENVKLTADPAFLLPAAPVSDFSFDPNREYLGFNISPILKDYTEGLLTSEEILTESAAFLNQVISNTNINILLVPHAMRPNNWNNDYELLGSLMRRINDQGRVSILPMRYNAGQLKYLISQCRFFMGARTHSTIAALSSNVPTISLSYSLKSKGINEDIFGKHDFLIQAKELNRDRLWEKFDKMKRDEKNIKDLLKLKIPIMKERAYANALYLRQKLYAII